MESVNFIDIVFDGPPSHESGRFVEVENAKGESINAGEWIDRGNGLWALRLSTRAPEAAPGWQLVPKEPDIAMASEGYLALQGAVGAIALASGDKNVVFNLWKAMLSAAPSAPSVDSGVSEREKPSLDDALPFGIIDREYGSVYTLARIIAWQEGYALALHGSFTRDLDLVAVPWTDAACEPEHLAKRIEEATKLKMNGEPTKRPFGRLTWTLIFPEFSNPRFVDLSIMPRVALPVADARNEGDKT